MKRIAKAKDAYHHGNLREALLKAAEEELAEAGIANFSLRRCARRAGVSHAAPTHHFGSADGLLAELAATGFRRLSEIIEAETARAVAPRARLLASGCGYVAFATANPTLFKLMFSAERPDAEAESVRAPAARAYEVLRSNIAAVSAGETEAEQAIRLAAAWSIVHGLSHLLIEGTPLFPPELDEEARAAAIAAVIERALPPGGGEPGRSA